MSETYRGYQISYAPPPIPDRRWDWSWVSENYDAWTDAGDWRDNGLAGQSASLDAARADIDEQIAENTCEEFDAAGTRWIIWESTDDLWRGEIQERYFAGDHSIFLEAATAERVKDEIREFNAVGHA